MRESWERMVEAKGKGGREEVMRERFSRMSFTTKSEGVRLGGLREMRWKGRGERRGGLEVDG